MKSGFTDGKIDGVTAFHLYDTYGFPIEFTEEMARDNGLNVDRAGFEAAFAEHQNKSKQGAEQRFKGGLVDANETTAKLHTATHLLQAALRKRAWRRRCPKGQQYNHGKAEVRFQL